MNIGFGNNVVSSLASDITASQTAITVMPGTGDKFAELLTTDFDNPTNTQGVYAKITLTDKTETVFEICHLLSLSGDILTVARGQEGTTAKGWSLNDMVANFATRGSENQFVQIEQLQSGHYISGVAGGTTNALTLELPATYFVNGATDWTLRTPIVVYPTQNNTGASTLQLTMGGRVLGTFKLYKGNKAELVANDILKGVGLICLLDSDKSFFNVSNPGAIYAGLGTAAFCDATTSTTDDKPGRVLKVGDRGLGLTGIVASNNFDFSIYEFAAGETLFINMATAINYPSELSVMAGEFVYLHVTGVRDTAYDASFILAPYTGSGGIHFCKRSTVSDGNVGWFVNKLPIIAADIGAMPVYPTPLAVDLNTLGASSSAGVYCQQMDVNATPELNYPVQQSGTLLVTPSAYGCQQEYTTFGSGMKFTRGLMDSFNGVDGPWQPWRKQYSENNPPPAPDLSGYETIADANSRFLTDMQLGASAAYGPENNTWSWDFDAPSGCILTGISIGDTGSNSADNINNVHYKPIQREINGAWATIAG